MQMQMPIGNLPVNLVLLPDGTLVFVKVGPVGLIIDAHETAVSALFTEDCFSINGEEFEYNRAYSYKEIEGMRQWLIQQRMQLKDGVVYA